MVYFRRSKSEDVEPDENIVKADATSPNYVDDFLEDWDKTHDLHKGQKQVIESFFDKDLDYMFVRAGRKFSKTTCNIKVAWKYCNLNPKVSCYYCFPTIVLAEQILWDEKRLQYCDMPHDYMYRKYVRNTNQSNKTITFQNGSFISLKGTWHEARSRGSQPNLVIFDEVQDCCADFMEGMDSNLLAKGGKCIMSGTPPKKRNHYHEWEERIKSHAKGHVFHFSSYANNKLPNGKKWLDNKRDELFKIHKQDVWFREYMAEDCFSSADRVLPDATFRPHDELMREISSFTLQERIPVMAIGNQGRYVCTLFGVMILRKKLFILDCENNLDMWQKSYALIFPSLTERSKKYKELCPNKMRVPIWDPSKSLSDVITGLSVCRDDVKWQDRGIPLLREMMTEGKVAFSENLADIGLECQNLLADESIKDIEKNYPVICTMSMLCNEYFQREKIVIEKEVGFDKYAPLRQFGLPCPPKKKFGESLYKQGI